jgi:hypothetical protein
MAKAVAAFSDGIASIRRCPVLRWHRKTKLSTHCRPLKILGAPNTAWLLEKTDFRSG